MKRKPLPVLKPSKEGLKNQILFALTHCKTVDQVADEVAVQFPSPSEILYAEWSTCPIRLARVSLLDRVHACMTIEQAQEVLLDFGLLLED